MDNQFAEQALIACLLNDGALSAEAAVDPSEFENAQYSLIYRSVNAVMSSDVAMDVVTVAEHMQKTTGKNWLPVLVELTQGPGTPTNFKAYSEIIQAAARSRKASEIGHTLTKNRNDPEVIQNAIRALMDIGRTQSKYEYSLNEAVKLAVAEVDRAFRNPGAIVGVSTGLKDLDATLGGYHPGDLVIIGARPSIGKTAIMLNQMFSAGEMVGCISGEQGVVQAAQRLLSMSGNVSLMSMRNGRMGESDWPMLEAGARRLVSHPGMRFYDKSGPTIEEIEACARRWKYEFDIKALYLDYLQRIEIDQKKQKHEAVGHNAKRLKNLGRELEIPVIALAQVGREVDKRPCKRPGMGDLSDSSEIEKEADLIIMAYRDEVYNPDTQDKGIMELNIGKNRHGATGLIRSAWDGRFLKLADLYRGGNCD